LNHFPNPFCFSYFANRILLLWWGRSRPWSSSYASYVTGMTGVCHHAQIFLVEMGSLEVFPWAGILFIYFWGAGLWTQGSWLLGRCYTTWANLPALFVLGIFKTGS
jgi:hypothetical protein